MPAPKCDGGKDSRRWVGRRCYPKRQNRLERWRDGRKGMDGRMEGWKEGGARKGKKGGERKGGGPILVHPLVLKSLETVLAEQYNIATAASDVETAAVKCYLRTFFPLVMTTPL